MNADPRAHIAHRIHLLLRRELGQGIEVPRLLAEALYARDVLLVCAAMPGTELATLAQQFRQAERRDLRQSSPGRRAAAAWLQGRVDEEGVPSTPPDIGPALPVPARRRGQDIWRSASRWLDRL